MVIGTLVGRVCFSVFLESVPTLDQVVTFPHPPPLSRFSTGIVSPETAMAIIAPIKGAMEAEYLFALFPTFNHVPEPPRAAREIHIYPK